MQGVELLALDPRHQAQIVPFVVAHPYNLVLEMSVLPDPALGVDFQRIVVGYNLGEDHREILVVLDCLAWFVLGLEICGFAANLQLEVPSECTVTKVLAPGQTSYDQGTLLGVVLGNSWETVRLLVMVGVVRLVDPPRGSRRTAERRSRSSVGEVLVSPRNRAEYSIAAVNYCGGVAGTGSDWETQDPMAVVGVNVAVGLGIAGAGLRARENPRSRFAQAELIAGDVLG